MVGLSVIVSRSVTYRELWPFWLFLAWMWVMVGAAILTGAV